MRQRKHTKQWELQAEVNNAVRICKTREEHKKKGEGRDKHSLDGKLLSVWSQRGVESLERNFYM